MHQVLCDWLRFGWDTARIGTGIEVEEFNENILKSLSGGVGRVSGVRGSYGMNKGLLKSLGGRWLENKVVSASSGPSVPLTLPTKEAVADVVMEELEEEEEVEDVVEEEEPDNIVLPGAQAEAPPPPPPPSTLVTLATTPARRKSTGFDIPAEERHKGIDG